MKARCALIALLIAGVSGINLAHVIRRVPPAPRSPDATATNTVLRHEQRLAPVRRALQKHGVRGTVGYLTELPAELLAADPRAMEEYFLSQFVLVPWVLDARPGAWRWAVTNFRAATPAANVDGFRVVEDCGGGVLLLEKLAP
jgi:hypothetical protein